MKSLSLAAFLVVGIGSFQSASAATLFRAELSGDQVVSSPTPDTQATGTATFSLSDDQSQLTYTIDLNGITLKPSISERTEPADVNKIHLHVGAPGNNGPHTLNIFGLPGEDDDDLQVDYQNGILTGIWDDSDASDLNGNGVADPNDSKPLSAFVSELLDGQLYVQVHTNRFDSPNGFPGELRGQIVRQSEPVQTPEPGALLGLLAMGLAAARGISTRQA